MRARKSGVRNRSGVTYSSFSSPRSAAAIRRSRSLRSTRLWTQAAGSQGQFELNVRVPLIARNLLDSIKLLAAGCRALDEKCVSGLEPNEAMLERHREGNLIVATALNEHIGYDKAGEIVKEAAASDRSIREVALEKGVDEKTLDEALDHRKMAKPHE